MVALNQSKAEEFTPVYLEPKVIAEIGCNHKGELAIAKELLTLAKEAGADVGKFQKRNPKELLTEDQYSAAHPNPDNSYGSTYGEHREFLELGVDDHRELQKHCKSINLEYSCSVWDTTSAKEIVTLNPTLIKVGSPSNQHFEMQLVLRDHYEGQVHISTGMTTKEEIEKIVSFWEQGKGDAKNRVILYNCTSGYPVPFEDVCLLEIRTLQERFGHRVKSIGFSGHHLGIAADVASYAMGCQWVERHFTKDRTWKGTDHAASLEPAGLGKLCRDLRAAWTCMTYKKTEILPLESATRGKLKWGQYNKEEAAASPTGSANPTSKADEPATKKRRFEVAYKEPRVIAEIGCNHKGELEIAKELLTIAKEAGANVGKFQKRNPKELLTSEQYNAAHPNPNNSYGSTYGEHREFLELSVDDHRELQKHCKSINLEYSCSVWDTTSAKEIVSLNPTLIKVGSPSNQHFEMQLVLRDHYEGEVHISTGMTTKEEIEKIVSFWEQGKGDAKNRVVLYNCTSGYPVPFEDVCLLEIRTLQERFGHRVKSVGFSGHHLGIAADIAAYAMGCQWVERHFTKDRTWKGTDHAASLEPAGLGKLCRDLRATWTCMTYKKTEILPLESATRGKLKWGQYNKDLAKK